MVRAEHLGVQDPGVSGVSAERAAIASLDRAHDLAMLVVGGGNEQELAPWSPEAVGVPGPGCHDDDLGRADLDELYVVVGVVRHVDLTDGDAEGLSDDLAADADGAGSTARDDEAGENDDKHSSPLHFFSPP